MTLFGYARVSTMDQDLAIQETALRAAGCQTIRSEKKSGTGREARTELQILLDFLRAEDTLVVTRIDRLARSMKDLQDIVHELKAKGVALKATEQPIDTGTAAGKAFLDMLGVFAEFETNLRRERQAEGIAAAKARGVYKGAFAGGGGILRQARPDSRREILLVAAFYGRARKATAQFYPAMATHFEGVWPNAPILNEAERTPKSLCRFIRFQHGQPNLCGTSRSGPAFDRRVN